MELVELVRENFLAGQYEKILSIVEESKKKKIRLVTKDWEFIHRIAATAAFVLAGGLSCKDAEMMERAKVEAIAAAQYAQSEHIPIANYNFIQALYVQIRFALGEKTAAFDYVTGAIDLYPDNSDLRAAHAAMLIQDGRYQEGLETAERASLLAEKENNNGKLAMTSYYRGLALKGLGRIEESRSAFEKAKSLQQSMQETSPDGGSAAAVVCIANADKELATLHQE